MHGNLNTWRPDTSVRLGEYDLFVMFCDGPHLLISADIDFLGCGRPDIPIRPSIKYIIVLIMVNDL